MSKYTYKGVFDDNEIHIGYVILKDGMIYHNSSDKFFVVYTNMVAVNEAIAELNTVEFITLDVGDRFKPVTAQNDDTLVKIVPTDLGYNEKTNALTYKKENTGRIQAYTIGSRTKVRKVVD